jgi:hypothetical protein
MNQAVVVDLLWLGSCLTSLDTDPKYKASNWSSSFSPPTETVALLLVHLLTGSCWSS